MVLCFCGGSSLAGEVRIEGDSPYEELTIRIEDAGVNDVLTQMAKKFGFELVGVNRSASDITWSTTLKGDLEMILARLLRNRNHSIVRAPGTHGKIRRIIFSDPKAGARDPAPPNPKPVNRGTTQQ